MESGSILLRSGADVNHLHENGEGTIAHDVINDHHYDKRSHPTKNVFSTLITAPKYQPKRWAGKNASFQGG